MKKLINIKAVHTRNEDNINTEKINYYIIFIK
jgi:hypothetical protein